MSFIYCHLNFHANLLRPWPFPLSNEFRIGQVICRRNEKQIRIGRLCLVLVGRSCAICITKALRILFELNSKLLYNIFYIGPSMSPRFPYEARERNWRADICRGLIPGTIWKLLCHKLFITYLTLTFFKHWLFYCRTNLWTDKLRKLILKRVAFVQLANILVSKRYQTGNVDLYNDVRKCLKKLHKKSTFGWKFLFNTTYTFELIIPFQVI